MGDRVREPVSVIGISAPKWRNRSGSVQEGHEPVPFHDRGVVAPQTDLSRLPQSSRERAIMSGPVTLIILGAAIAAAFLLIYSVALFVRVGDRLRARRLELPYAGRAELRLPTSLIGSEFDPELNEATRNFRVSWLVRGLHRGFPVSPKGVLTVRTAGGGCHLAWEPSGRSRRRGADPWQLEGKKIASIRILRSILMTTDFTIATVSQTHVELNTVSAGRLWRAFAGTGIVIERPSDQPDRPAGQVPSLRLSPETLRRQEAESEALAASTPEQMDQELLKWLFSTHFLSTHKLTWDEVADGMHVTPWKAWNLLKNNPPAELAQYGLSVEDPPPRDRPRPGEPTA
jgi:hypothetical protein